MPDSLGRETEDLRVAQNCLHCVLRVSQRFITDLVHEDLLDQFGCLVSVFLRLFALRACLSRAEFGRILRCLRLHHEKLVWLEAIRRRLRLLNRWFVVLGKMVFVHLGHFSFLNNLLRVVALLVRHQGALLRLLILESCGMIQTHRDRQQLLSARRGSQRVQLFHWR